MTDEARNLGHSSRVILGRCLLAVAVVPFVVWAVLLAKYGVDVIRAEQWHMPFPTVRDFFTGEGSFEVLLQQHNESRKVFPRLLSTGLAIANGTWNTHLELAIGYVMCVCVVLTMVVCVMKTPLKEYWQGGFIIAMFSLILWSPETWHFHTNSITFERFIPELCLLLGLWLFMSGLGIWLQGFGLAVLAVIAQFSFSGGLALWPLFLLLMLGYIWEGRAKALPALVLFLALFSLSLLAYFWDYRPSDTNPLGSVLEFPVARVAQFFLMVLGRPIAGDFWPGVGLGALALFLYLGACVAALRSTGVTRHWLAWVTLGLYSISQATMATIARMPIEMGNATRPDYAIIGSYLLIASLALICMGGRRQKSKPGFPGLRIELFVTVFILGALLGAQTESTIGRLKQQVYELRQVKACLQLAELVSLAGCTPRYYRWPYNILQRLRDADRLGIIEPGLVQKIQPYGEAQVYGHVKSSFWSRQGPLHFAGWAVVEGRIPDAVVITAETKEDQEIVIAVFRSGVASNVQIGPSRETFKDAGWGGDIPKEKLIYDADKPNCGLRAYAMNAKQNTFFEIRWAKNAVVSWCPV